MANLIFAGFMLGILSLANYYGLPFLIGLLLGVLIMQAAHYSRYGDFFE